MFAIRRLSDGKYLSPRGGGDRQRAWGKKPALWHAIGSVKQVDVGLPPSQIEYVMFDLQESDHIPAGMPNSLDGVLR